MAVALFPTYKYINKPPPLLFIQEKAVWSLRDPGFYQTGRVLQRDCYQVAFWELYCLSLVPYEGLKVRLFQPAPNLTAPVL